MTFQVKLDMFEGPLDLLLHLIREHQLDILNIPIAWFGLASPDGGAFPVSAIYEIALVVSIHASAREATHPSVHPHARAEYRRNSLQAIT